MEQGDQDVIIVGGGLSGLYACKLLKDVGVKVLLLEGNSRVAGRQWTKQTSGHFTDLGGAYIGKRQDKVLEVLDLLGLETYQLKADLNSVLHMKVPAEKPWEAPRAKEWDSMSCHDALDKLCWTSTAKFLANKAIEAVYITDPKHISFLYFLQELRICGGLEAMTAVTNGLQEMKVKTGSGSISTKLAESLKGNILFNSHVTSVNQSDQGIVIKTEDGRTFKTKKVITAVPPPSLNRIQFKPVLPPYLQKLVSQEINCHCIKAVVYYKKAFWREKGFNGESISETGLMTFSIDDTKFDDSYPAILGFITSDHAKRMWKKTKEERCKEVCEHYYEVFGLKDFLEPIAYEEKYWFDEEADRFSGGCCVWTLPPGVITDVKRLPGKPHGNIHFSGSETALTFRGYMDGALRTGQRAAMEVMESMDISTSHLSDEFKAKNIPYIPKPWILNLVPEIEHVVIVIMVLILPFFLHIFVEFFY